MQTALAHLATNLPPESAHVAAASPAAQPATVADALKTIKTGLAGFLKPDPSHPPAAATPATKKAPVRKPAK